MWRQHPKVRCLIVGGVHRAGERYAKWTPADALGLARACVSSASVTTPDVINALDVAVHASAVEPPGRVILEGMLMGSRSWRPTRAACRS